MAKRRRRNGDRAGFWREVIARQQRSGDSIRAFCSVNGLGEPSFYWWRRRLAGLDAKAGGRARRELSTSEPGAPGASRVPGPQTPTFVPVRLVTEIEPDVSSSALPAGTIELVLSEGRCVRLRGPVDAAALATVLEVLREDADRRRREAR
jgi:hypothetical protein